MKRTRRAARLVGVAAALAAVGVFVSSADAAQVGVYRYYPPNEPQFDFYEVEFYATPGESNALTVTMSGGGTVATIRDTGGTFLPVPPPGAAEGCEIVSAHEARCSHTNPDGTARQLLQVIADLADGTNSYRVGPGSEAFQGSVDARGIGDNINTGGMTGDIEEAGVQAHLVLGSQAGPGTVGLSGPSVGDWVSTANGTPSDIIYCDNGNAHPAAIRADAGDYVYSGCPAAKTR